ncbi:unnamed protein product [Notodromas monacha]|uniref:Uncharacterized protein n=1 Tax=Notodromas monacha TaxID=399045 RepID=A0A7R9BT66_9CRUS|nr:unnamed protein product [Notodromas monacha]CAG0921294.1 unnamed protein product [Notodromas monacha]
MESGFNCLGQRLRRHVCDRRAPSPRNHHSSRCNSSHGLFRMNANEALLYNDFQNDEEESLDRFSVSVDQEDNARLEADSDESDVDAKVDRNEAMADAAGTALKSSDSRNVGEDEAITGAQSKISDPNVQPKVVSRRSRSRRRRRPRKSAASKSRGSRYHDDTTYDDDGEPVTQCLHLDDDRSRESRLRRLRKSARAHKPCDCCPKPCPPPCPKPCCCPPPCPKPCPPPVSTSMLSPTMPKTMLSTSMLSTTLSKAMLLSTTLPKTMLPTTLLSTTLPQAMLSTTLPQAMLSTTLPQAMLPTTLSKAMLPTTLSKAMLPTTMP